MRRRAVKAEPEFPPIPVRDHPKVKALMTRAGSRQLVLRQLPEPHAWALFTARGTCVRRGTLEQLRAWVDVQEG
jgi:hypothetical protein